MDVQPWLTVTPKLSVMRFEKSIPRFNCEAGGTSAVCDQATVGSDISSATQGSSMASVAGRKRAPTKQWASACEVQVRAMTPASARACGKCRDIGISRPEKRERKCGQPLRQGLMHYTLSGGPRGRAAEYCDDEGRRSARPECRNLRNSRSVDA